MDNTIPENFVWDINKEEILVRWGEESYGYSWMHMKAVRYYSFRSIIFWCLRKTVKKHKQLVIKHNELITIIREELVKKAFKSISR